jgi:hypothetical protein
MANTFLKDEAALTTSMADVYTPAASTTAIIFSFAVANIDGVNDATVTIQLEDSDAGATYTTLLNTIPVYADTTLVYPGKIVLGAGESLQGQASADGDLTLILSILEIT